MDKKDFLSELQGRGFDFRDKSHSEFGFNDEVLNMVYEMWQVGKAQAIPDGFVLAPKEPSSKLVNHGHQVFLGHFNGGGQTGGLSLYFAYKAMVEAGHENK